MRSDETALVEVNLGRSKMVNMSDADVTDR